MATIDDFGGVGQPLQNPPLGGPGGWAAAVRDKLRVLEGGLPSITFELDVLAVGADPNISQETVGDITTVTVGIPEPWPAAPFDVAPVATGDADAYLSGNAEDGYTLHLTLPAVGDGTIGEDALTGDLRRKVRDPDLYVLPRYPVIPVHAATTSASAVRDVIVTMPFTAPRDMVATGIRVVSRAATTGATEVRLGLYHVAHHLANGSRAVLGLLARTANDTTILGSNDTGYAVPFNDAGGYGEAVRLVAGETYAVAYMILGASASLGSIVGPPEFRYTAPGWQGISAGGTASAINPPPSGLSPTINGDTLPPFYNAGFYAELVIDTESQMPAPKRTVVLGDSIAGGYGQWIARANGQAGAPLLLFRNGAVGGSELPAATTSVATWVTPSRPEVVIVHSGVNDIAYGASLATMQARYTALFDALDAADVPQIVCCTPPPNVSNSGAANTILGQVRSWLMGLSRAGLIVVDTGIALSTGDGVTGDASKVVDGVHPNAAGQQAMADVLDGVLAAL